VLRINKCREKQKSPPAKVPAETSVSMQAPAGGDLLVLL
jgi:hypothetical protein